MRSILRMIALAALLGPTLTCYTSYGDSLWGSAARSKLELVLLAATANHQAELARTNVKTRRLEFMEAMLLVNPANDTDRYYCRQRVNECEFAIIVTGTNVQSTDATASASLDALAGLLLGITCYQDLTVCDGTDSGTTYYYYSDSSD